MLPGALGDLGGEVLYVVAACGGIHDLVQIGLLLEQELLVAGYAVAEVVCFLVGVVEGQHRDAVGTGHGARHGLRGGAQHVHIRVVDRLVPAAGGGVDEELVGAVALWLVLLHDLAPQHTGGADLGDLHEVGAAHAHAKLYAAGHTVGLAAHVRQAAHQLVGGGKAEAELLHDVGAAVVQQLAVDGEHTELGQLVVGILHQLLGHLEVALLAAVELAVGQRIAEHVEVRRAAELLGIVTGLASILHIELEELQVVA